MKIYLINLQEAQPNTDKMFLGICRANNPHNSKNTEKCGMQSSVIQGQMCVMRCVGFLG